MRKGALNEAVKEMGCNKVAYAHHKDDIIETMLLSLILKEDFIPFLQNIFRSYGSYCYPSYDVYR